MAILDATGRHELSTEGAPRMLLQAEADGPVTLPEGFSLSSADFSRSGDSLTVTAPNGELVVIRDFFNGENSPDLVTPDGARMSGELAGHLAGPLAPPPLAISLTGKSCRQRSKATCS